MVSQSSDGCSDTTPSKPGKRCRNQAGGSVARLSGDVTRSGSKSQIALASAELIPRSSRLNTNALNGVIRVPTRKADCFRVAVVDGWVRI